MAVVRKHVPDVQCMIIGSLDPEPDYVQRIRQTIRELNLDGHVHLLGHVPENILLGWYGAADVFALPSMNDGWKFEGYGLAHLEASAAGLSVIGTSDCGAEDAIEDGITGILVSQVKVEDELPAAIIRLLTDKALAARLGAAGKTKAQTQTWDFVARQMIAVYQREAV
jgi:glycosyltransferase involved in cell wall biosynthesis